MRAADDGKARRPDLHHFSLFPAGYGRAMQGPNTHGGDDVVGDDDRNGLTGRLIDALHTEAMILADEARGYFDTQGRVERDGLSPSDRVSFSCESLKVTTRLMHIVAWLLTRRTSSPRDVSGLPRRPLGDGVASDPAAVATLPVTARQLIDASRDLYDRVRRLELGMAGMAAGDDVPSPARTLLQRLERVW
jgi:regulator of CtrA degradation